MQWTWKVLVIVGLLAALAPVSALALESADTGQVARFQKAIAAYEDLFTRSRIVWSTDVGAMQVANVVLTDMETERIVDGPSAYMKNTGRTVGGETLVVDIAVSDGKACRVLSNVGSGWQGIVDGATEDALSRFQNYLFQPHRGYGFNNASRVEILGDDGHEVHLRYHRENTYMDADYVWHGAYLRVTRYQSGSKNARAQVAGTEYRYHYKDQATGDAQLAPVQIEQTSRLHGVHGIYEISAVDFDPVIAEDQFKLTFPDGTYVRDSTAQEETKP